MELKKLKMAKMNKAGRKEGSGRGILLYLLSPILDGLKNY